MSLEGLKKRTSTKVRTDVLDGVLTAKGNASQSVRYLITEPNPVKRDEFAPYRLIDGRFVHSLGFPESFAKIKKRFKNAQVFGATPAIMEAFSDVEEFDILPAPWIDKIGNVVDAEILQDEKPKRTRRKKDEIESDEVESNLDEKENG